MRKFHWAQGLLGWEVDRAQESGCLRSSDSLILSGVQRCVGAEAGAGRPCFSSAKAGPPAGSGDEHAAGKPPSDRRGVEVGGGGTRPGLRLLAPSDLPSSPTPGLGTLGRVSAVGAAGGPAAALASTPPGESRWPGRPRCGEGVLPAAGAGDAPGPWPGWGSSLECCRVSGCGSCPRASGKEEWKPVNWKPCFNSSLEVFSDYESNQFVFILQVILLTVPFSFGVFTSVFSLQIAEGKSYFIEACLSSHGSAGSSQPGSGTWRWLWETGPAPHSSRGSPWAHPRAPGASSGRLGQGSPASAPSPNTPCSARRPSLYLGTGLPVSFNSPQKYLSFLLLAW